MVALISLQELPLESDSLVHLFHSRGINMRYLGRVAESCRDLCKRYPQLVYMQGLCEREMILRAAKHRASQVCVSRVCVCVCVCTFVCIQLYMCVVV